MTKFNWLFWICILCLAVIWPVYALVTQNADETFKTVAMIITIVLSVVFVGLMIFSSKKFKENNDKSKNKDK